MKAIRSARLAGIVLAASLAPPLGAYEFITHQLFSTAAANGSNLRNGEVAQRLGLRYPIDDFRQVFPNSRGDVNTVLGLIGDGAMFEDVPAIRVLNHFYDPVADSGLLFTSPYWAVDDGFFAAPLQRFSLRRAREYQFQSLTNPSAVTRETNAGLLYETVGHVVHHIQDMAQPQHVRMDAHLNVQDTLQRWDRPDGELFFEHRSRYELYTENNSLAVSALMAASPSPPQFSRPRDYWRNDAGTGIAQYTNMNFVSAGTNFQLRNGQAVAGDRYANPQPSPTPTEIRPIAALFAAKGKPVPAQVAAACPGPSDCNVLFFGSPVSTRASSLSIFNEDLVATGAPVTYVNPDTGDTYQVDRLFALNEFNFDAAHALLLPKATDYSAGLINFIFRGTLGIAAPAEGIYSIIDPTQASSFQKIKVKVTNTTPNETMAGGRLWATATFHKNTCYRSDLTGELGGPNAPPDFLSFFFGCRSAFDETVISAQSDPVTLASGASTTVSFNFGSTPIPVNATDLVLQVVYRGSLGTESDAVAVGYKDLFEPSHIAYMNGTDIIEINDLFYTFDQILAGIANGDQTFAAVDGNQDRRYTVPPDANVFPFNFGNVQVSFTGPFQNVVATIPSVPFGRFARLAVLSDQDTLDFWPNTNHFRPFTSVNQLNGNTYTFTSPFKFRDVWVINADILFDCVFPTSCNGDLSTIPPSQVTDATTPMQVNVTMGFQ